MPASPGHDSETALQLILLNYLREHPISSIGEIFSVIALNADRTVDEHIAQVGRSLLLSWIDRGWVEVLGNSLGEDDIRDLIELRAAIAGGKVRRGEWIGLGANTLIQLTDRATHAPEPGAA